jgi:hypothetical protein
MSVLLDIRADGTDTFRIHKPANRLKPEDPSSNLHQTNYRLDPVLNSLRLAGDCPAIIQKFFQVESTRIPKICASSAL